MSDGIVLFIPTRTLCFAGSSRQIQFKVSHGDPARQETPVVTFFTFFFVAKKHEKYQALDHPLGWLRSIHVAVAYKSYSSSCV
jgi:hypothetical protein